MATKSSQSSSKAGEFTFDAREHGHPDGPGKVFVELIPGAARTNVAILAAGADGRYSFDFSISTRGVEIEKAYVEGMREPVGQLPDWVESVRERIEERLGVGDT